MFQPKKIGLVFCFLIGACSSLKPDLPATQPSSFLGKGLISLDEKNYEKAEPLKMMRLFGNPASNTKKLPQQIDLSDQLPRAGNQGHQNSCTGFAIAYAIKSLQENRKWGLDLKEQSHLFSPSFLYNQINNGQDKGATLSQALNVASQIGNVPLGAMPYNENDYLSQPSADTKKWASYFRLGGFRKLPKINDVIIKNILAAREPVLLTIALDPEFTSENINHSDGFYNGNGQATLGYHVVVAVGYDDKGIKILNSWGEDWGLKGFAFISFEKIPSIIKQAFVLYDYPTAQEAIASLKKGQMMPPASIPAPSLSAPNNNAVAINSGTGTPQQYMPPVSIPAPTFQDKKSEPVVGSFNPEQSIILYAYESGINFRGQWLRLLENHSRGEDLFKSATPKPDLLNGDIRILKDDLGQNLISKFEFYDTSPIPVYTNEGITFGATHDDVARIYGRPDYTDLTSGDQYYYFESLIQEWGGVKVSKQTALSFHFDRTTGLVSVISLESLYKDVLEKNILKDVNKTESINKIVQEGETSRITNPYFKADVPAAYSEIKESNFGQSGMGLLLRNPKKIFDFVNFTAFYFDSPVTPELFKERINAEIKTRILDENSLREVNTTAARWTCYSDGNNSHFYYGIINSAIIQVIISTGNPDEESQILNSINSP